jgi:hypothetical protein
MRIDETIKLIQNNELEQLQVLCSKFDTLNDLPVTVFIKKLARRRSWMRENETIRMYEKNRDVETAPYLTVQEYLEDKDFFDNSIIDPKLNPLKKFKDLLLLGDNEYINGYILHNSLNGIPKENDKNYFKTICFEDESEQILELHFELNIINDDVKNIWFSRFGNSDQVEISPRYLAAEIKPRVDEFKYYKKTAEFFKLEEKAKKNQLIYQMYNSKALNGKEVQQLYDSLPFKEGAFSNEWSYALGFNWSQFINLANYLSICLMHVDEYLTGLVDYQQINIKNKDEITSWLNKQNHLKEDLFEYLLHDIDEEFIKEYEDYYELGDEIKLKIIKEEYKILYDFLHILWEVHCDGIEIDGY